MDSIPYSHIQLKRKLLYLLTICFLSIFIFSCKSTQKRNITPQVIISDAIKVDSTNKKLDIYQSSKTKNWDLVDTKLDVYFDWNNCFLLGKSTITLKPHFYSSLIVYIDAVGFTLNDISMLNGNIKTKLKYEYNNKQIKISLPRQFAKDEILKLYIDYIAKPNQLKVSGSDAIAADKGLYFINPQGLEKNKPQQIWTQSETQSASCWFPTIDAPNQKMTQEISITVEKKYTTLSNGLLIWQQLNADSTRTDIWKQSLPAAPYLTMIAVGKFADIKDTWNNIEVNYLLEPQYEQFAKQIFGRTPEMLAFFSKIFGVNYPWEKYSQIVVRDYISGAMENTSATLHGEFLQKNDRELLDNNSDDYIAHELTHQWFGDLVTCESWSNLTLNEGFATYGEYLWLYNKYGADEADYHFKNDLLSYLNETRNKQEDLVRFYYDDKEDMFDSHSYAKGARVLHMLRNVVGDEAFFASIKHYLEKHKFKSVEIHDLRIAFEEITGTDLNWFYNQWFLESGHPKLNFNYTYNDTTKKQIVYIEQAPSNENGIMYRLPIRIDVYNKAKIDTHYVVISQQKDTFYFEANYKPEFVNVDAEKILVCDKIDNKSITEWISQFIRCTNYIDKLEALQFLENKFNDSDVPELFARALVDKNWHIRNYATNIVKEHAKENSSLFKSTLIKLAQKDEKSLVRASAIDALSHSYDDRDLMNVYKRAIDDASYTVESEALQAIFKADKELGIEFARTFETDSIATIIATLCNIYSLEGEERDNEYFLKAECWLRSSEKYNFCKSYSTFLLNKSDSTINKSLPLFEKIASSENTWYVRLAGFNALDLLKDLYLTKKKETLESIKNLQSKKAKDVEIISIQNQLEFNETQYAHISSIIRSIKSRETNKNLVEIYGKLN